MRQLAHVVPGTFDVVLSCDNSLPHLLSKDDLMAALRNMRQKVKPDGIVVIGIRDYDEAVRAQPRATTPLAHDGSDGRSITFQVWEWEVDGRTYALNQFILTQDAESWQTRCHTTRYRALLRDELSAMLESTGYAEITWHMPESTGHHQPLVTART